jgi:small-conductance mechanosensitive channel
MFIEALTRKHLFLGIGFIIGGLLIGIIIERIILVKMKKFAERTSWKGDELIITAIRGIGILWFTLAGIYLTVMNLPVQPNITLMIQKTILVIIVISATIVISKIAVGLITLHSKKTANLPSASLFVNLTKILIFAIGVLIVLQSVGISITPLITALGVGGLAVALALQPTLSNLFAGLQIIISKQVEVGDYVQLDSGQKGYVTDISWRNTKIREIPNNLIVVPNSKLANAIVTNFHQPQKEMLLVIECGVSYDSDLEKVEKTTVKVAKWVLEKIQGGILDLEPFVRFHTFGDSSINFNVTLRIKEVFNQYLIKHEFIKALHKQYKKESIDIPFPIRTLYMKNKDEKTS